MFPLKISTNLIIFLNAIFLCSCGVAFNSPVESLSSETSWELTDILSVDAGYSSLAMASSYSAKGAISTVGFLENASNGVQWIVRRKESATSNWAGVDTYQKNTGWDAMANDIAYDSSGRAWVVGQAFDSTGAEHWIVRAEQTDGTWVTSDDYQLNSGSHAAAQAIAIDSSDNVYVTGLATDASSTQHMIVRKYSGSAWSTLYNFQYIASNDAMGLAISIDPITNDVVVGGMSEESGSAFWLVRRYTGSWNAIDHYQLSSGKDAIARSVEFDGSGNLYIAGWAYDSSNSANWIVRFLGVSTPLGTPNLDDQYQFTSGNNAFGTSIAYSSEDETMYSAGSAQDSSSKNYAIVKKLESDQWINQYEAGSTDDYPVAFDLSISDENQSIISGGEVSSSTTFTWIVYEKDAN